MRLKQEKQKKKSVGRKKIPDDPISIADGIFKPIGGIILLVVLFKYMPTNAPSLGKLIVWAVTCSIVSGALWVGLVRISQYVSQNGRITVLRKSTGMFGGNGKEPNGPESLIWTAVVFCPLVFAAIYFTSNQRADYPISAFMGYLIGTAVGAFIFYGNGMRERFLRHNYSYFKRETWLVFWWAVLLATFGFVGHEIGQIIHGGWDTLNVQRVLTQISVVVVLEWSAVTGFVLLIPGDGHENVRGMWAGAFLALASFAALLITKPSDLINALRQFISPL